MKRMTCFNKVIYILPVVAWDKRDEEHNTLFIGWLSFLFYKYYKTLISFLLLFIIIYIIY